MPKSKEETSKNENEQVEERVPPVTYKTFDVKRLTSEEPQETEFNQYQETAFMRYNHETIGEAAAI